MCPKEISLLLTGVFLLLAGSVLAAKVEHEVTQPMNQAISLQQSTQKQEEQWREKKEKLQSQLDELLARNKELNDRKLEIEHVVETSRARIADKKKQLADIAALTGEISPIIDELYDRLIEIVEADLPFLPEERKQRVDALGPVLEDPSVDLSEKYRKVMEALLVEAEYGFTNDVYQQTINIETTPILVDIFRFGRLGLFYLSLDKKQCGFYNVAVNTWQPLAVKYLPEIRKAVAIGLRQQPAELLDLPVGRMVKQ